MSFENSFIQVVGTVITTAGAILVAYIVNQRFKKANKPKEIQYIDIAFTQLEGYAKNLYKDNLDLRAEIAKKDIVIDRQKIEIDSLRRQMDEKNINPNVEINNT